MILHNDKELFEQAVLRASDDMGIEAGIIEKDYFVTLMLKEIVKSQPDILFKGGTSLSKCYKLINRFSEDIDLNLIGDEKPSESKRKNLKKHIVAATDKYGFEVLNYDEIRSRRDFNKYIIDFPSIFGISGIKPYLIIETAIFFRSYPYKEMEASSLIYDYLLKTGLNDVIEKYSLQPFKINVQTADRTLVDKVFALCDYYLSGRITEHSRHIYDIYKLLEVVEFNDELKSLAESVRQERTINKTCLSAAEGVDINALLGEIIDKKVYKDDYESITEVLLYDSVDYETALSGIKRVVESGVFKK